ncbi:hypothetical protein FA09DRAFT_170940 [Tilletiopsis washingtonensis]|uniref:Uncharacterized protein n=1 Tax=Tilletiopsis washingtonensis TaxID=58919 RepID=A0A316Z118_9BASI|nr:hypothetical protein FA09DRAFT_170940 [Tilletiopsis washingtonensis]PWN94628.1 hypothetical protein FA09DRAFT_170940 [Tilletiopsis washingtonensis]
MCRTPRDLACAAAAGVARPCAYRCRAAAVLDAQCRRRRSRSTAPHGRAAALCRRRSRAPFSFGADDGSAKARLRHAVHVLCCPASRQRHERAARPDLARCCTAHARVTAPLWSPQQLQLEVFDTAKCDLKRGRGNAAFPMESWHMKRDGPRRRACEATIAVGGVERRICAAGAAPALRERMSLRSATSRRGDPHRHPHPAPSLHIVSPTAAALADAASTAAFVGALSLSLSLSLRLFCALAPEAAPHSAKQRLAVRESLRCVHAGIGSGGRCRRCAPASLAAKATCAPVGLPFYRAAWHGCMRCTILDSMADEEEPARPSAAGAEQRKRCMRWRHACTMARRRRRCQACRCGSRRKGRSPSSSEACAASARQAHAAPRMNTSQVSLGRKVRSGAEQGRGPWGAEIGAAKRDGSEGGARHYVSVSEGDQ